MRTVCQLNLAACKLKAKKYREALSICQDVSIRSHYSILVFAFKCFMLK